MTNQHASDRRRGPTGTDFTIQGKPAEAVLMHAWTIGCGR
jgi:hypothetical protein